MAKYLVTVASEVYHTFEIEAELTEAPDTYLWNHSATALRDMAWKKPSSEAIDTESAFIDYLEIEEV